MRHFIWTFDQSTERVRMIRHDPDTPITFEPVYGHGMVLGHHREGFRVEEILARATSAPRAEHGHAPIGDGYWSAQVSSDELGCQLGCQTVENANGRSTDRPFSSIKLGAEGGDRTRTT